MTRPPRPRRRGSAVLVLSTGLLFSLAGLAVGQPPAEPKEAAKSNPMAPANSLPGEWARALTWRCIGPANMGGRVTALSISPTDPSTFWVATGGGGLLKTSNNGITFEHQFDKEATVSLGDVCVAPSNKDIVWVGTGENNPRNSVSYGDGVYKSTDGGKSWQNMGLKKTFQIGKILIHPTNPDVVYVGALGRLYGPSSDRGLFKTTDGGKTWAKVLFVNDMTGVIDMRMHPTEPDTIVVALYERQRDGYDVNEPAKRYGEAAGIYRTRDGGKTFEHVTRGLPTCKIGRIGLDWYVKNPNVVFAMVESENYGKAPAGVTVAAAGYSGIIPDEESSEVGGKVQNVAPGSPAERAGIRQGDVVTKVGDKLVKSPQDLLEVMRDVKAGATVKMKVRRDKEEKDVEVTLIDRPARQGGGGGGGGGGGQRDPSRPFAAQFNGQQENIQDRQGPDGYQYGGLYRSDDAGESWKRINSISPRPMYFSQVRVDPNDDHYLYVAGVSMARSTDGGKTFRNDIRGIHADQHALWIDPRDGRHLIVGCDGGFYASYDRGVNWLHLCNVAIGQFYHVAIDTRPDYKVYGGLQDNGTWGGPSRTHTGGGPVNEDWVSVGGGDGFRCQVDPNDPDQVYYTSQYGAMGRRNFRTGETGFIRPGGGGRGGAGGGGGGGGSGGGVSQYRWNWNTPFILSSHNTKIFYCAGNHVFRSLDRGNDLQMISPDITATKEGSATALSESPRNANVLYVGTDDGYLWVTKDGGKEWTNITKNVGLPGLRWVASIEASRYADGRAYVIFDGHRSDDDDPYVYVTEDYGKTWKSLRANLPWGSTRVCREDIKNPNLLYLGTEFAAWASTNRGESWTKINNNLPTVAVHEFAQHPTTGEVVVATHGRSIWICDISALRQMTSEALKADVTLFKPTDAIRWHTEPGHGRSGLNFVGENPQPGTQVYYVLKKPAEKVSLKVVNIDGETVRELQSFSSAGLHVVNWNLSANPPRQQGAAANQGRGGGGGGPGAGGGGGGGGGGRGFGGRGGFGRPVAAGSYRVILTVDGKEYAQSVKVEADPNAPAGSAAAGEEETERN